MFTHVHLPNSGLGFLAFFGFRVIIITESGVRAMTKGTALMAPHSWWLMTGYVAAAAYCNLVHAFLKWREARLGYESPGADHTLGRVPIHS